jgi:FixJ family two-component response regulator
MTLTKFVTSIFILAADPIVGLSQKCFLATHDYQVEIIDPDRAFEPENIARGDILLLDMDLNSTSNYVNLDFFIKLEERPKILVIAFEGQVFENTDVLHGGPSQFLLKPFLPVDLLKAISSLVETPDV